MFALAARASAFSATPARGSNAGCPDNTRRALTFRVVPVARGGRSVSEIRTALEQTSLEQTSRIAH